MSCVLNIYASVTHARTRCIRGQRRECSMGIYSTSVTGIGLDMVLSRDLHPPSPHTHTLQFIPSGMDLDLHLTTYAEHTCLLSTCYGYVMRSFIRFWRRRGNDSVPFMFPQHA